MGKRRRRYVFREGLGRPIWTKYPPFRDTETGQKSLQRFLEVQAKLIVDKKIKNAPEGDHITFGSLGAESFKNHWFKKSSLAGESAQTGPPT